MGATVSKNKIGADPEVFDLDFEKPINDFSIKLESAAAVLGEDQ